MELISFTAERRGADALLRWATPAETNSAYFGVESSADGRSFRPIGQVAGRGTTTQRTDYQYTDPDLARYASETLYYRLRQVDADGTESYSAVQTLTVPAQAGLAVQAWPNPFQQEAVQLLISTAQAGPGTIELTNVLGQVLVQLPVQLRKGSNAVTLAQAAQLSKGVYMVRVRQDGLLQVQKLVSR